MNSAETAGPLTTGWDDQNEQQAETKEMNN